MASPILLKKEPLRLVLDGQISVGKTAWLNALTTGQYRKARTIPHTKLAENHKYSAVVKGEKYKTVIHDTNGEKSKFRTVNFEIYKSADVIIEFFSIDRPTSFDEVINRRIPFIGSNFPKTPILLVGSMSDAKNAPKPKKSYFPSAFGPFVAKRVGAFKYVECSALKNFNVNKVMEEAIWAASTASSRMRHDVYHDVNSMVIDKVSPGSEWLDRIKQLNVREYRSFCTETDNSFQEDLELLDRQFTQFEAVYQDDASFKGIYISRNLELERILISHSRNERFLSELRQPICAMWYTFELETKPQKAARFHVFQPSYDADVSCEINTLTDKGNDSAINLFVVKQDCSKVMELLTTTRNLHIRSLVIVDCDGTLTFSFLSHLNRLEYLVIKDTCVGIETLDFQYGNTMKHLVLNNCGIIEPIAVPSVIGKLKNLELLNVSRNNFESLPSELGCLRNIKLLIIDRENVVSPSTEELNKSAREIFSDLALKPANLVENKVAKLVVVGQKKVGKTTLIRALKGTTPKNGDELSPEISSLNFHDVECKVFDFPGDVEYLNTHSLIFSPNSLNLVVFDLSQVTLSNKVRSGFNLCRLGLWLNAIASQDKSSHVIIVGTHADASSVCDDILQINRMLIRNLFSKHGPIHIQEFSTEPSKRCIICNPDLAPDSVKQDPNVATNSSGDASVSLNEPANIPHILGYYEISSVDLEKSNTGVSELKFQLNQSLDYLMKESKCEFMCEKWSSFCTVLKELVCTSSVLKKEPVMPLSRIYELATAYEIYDEDQVLAMLRFFHSQGTFLWYEDLPEMKNIVILDPQWLSDQLRTLISYRPSVSSICDGVLHLSELSTVWSQMSDDNRRNLLALFRSVGLCFSISETEELFPCNLAVGWPDREIWPQVPNPGENQTSLVFKFSFVPPSFFPDLIAEVNKKNETFARNVKPLYSRFHIVYIRKDQRKSTSLNDIDAVAKGDTSTTEGHGDCLPTHHLRVHYELMPYTNSLTVAVRGPDPPSIIPDIRSTIETVRRRRYPGITYSESMLCPGCVMKRVQPPASFRFDVPHDGVCSRGHIVGSNQNIFRGKYSSAEIVPSAIGQTRQVVGETLEDHECPKKFVILPNNFAKGLSLLERFVTSNLADGFTLHLVCECPDQCHFVDNPGYPVTKPKEFLEKHGELLCTGLCVFNTICDFAAAIHLPPLEMITIPLGMVSSKLYEYIQSIRDLCLDRYPQLKSSLGSSKDDLINLKSPSALKCSELSTFLLKIEAKGDNFGPLARTYVQKHDQWLWLCQEHNERFQIVQRNDSHLDGVSVLK